MPPVPALAALALLLLLPGLLVVRAPWTAVPALSLAFWAVAGWWPPLAWGSRVRGLSSLLLVCAGLALLRLLPKHEVEPPAGFEAPPAPAPPVRPGLPPPPLAATASLLVLAVAVALVLASSWAAHAPGPTHAPRRRAHRPGSCGRGAAWRRQPPCRDICGRACATGFQ
jgi:hypothetical protein